MKSLLAAIACLVVLPTVVVGQPGCRQAAASVVLSGDAFTIWKISLPSRTGYIAARAVIPATGQQAGAYVFSLSKLVASEPHRIVNMMPEAVELAKKGHPSVMLQRTLTWPEVDTSVGKAQADALCGEQWLSAHAAVKPDDWTFVGPRADVPTFEQLKAVGDATSMTFQWGFSIGGENDYQTTDEVLRDSSVIALLADVHE